VHAQLVMTVIVSSPSTAQQLLAVVSGLITDVMIGEDIAIKLT
jgi:hypothetical protein